MCRRHVVQAQFVVLMGPPAWLLLSFLVMESS